MGKKLHEEYQVINLVMEYGGALSGFKYAVASYLPEKELRMKYRKELAKYEPYLYLTGEQGEAIKDSVRNNLKFRKRQMLRGDAYGYDDGVMETYHKDVHILHGTDLRERAGDPLEILVSREEYDEQQKILNSRLDALEDAMKYLTECQVRRLRMVYVDKLTEEEISLREKVERSAIHDSVVRARKKLRKKMQSKKS